MQRDDIARGSGVRSGLAGRIRLVAGMALVAIGLLLAAATTRARAFDDLLPDIVDGAPAALGHEVGNDSARGPFAFAVIAAPRGDAAALERAFSAIRDRGNVSTTVVLGDILPTDGSSVVPLTEVIARNWYGLVLLAGPNDASVDIDDARLAARVLPPEGWAFVHNGCVFRGALSADEHVRAEFAGTDTSFTFVASPAVERAGATTSFAPGPVSDDDLHCVIAHVGREGQIRREAFAVARGATMWDAARHTALAVLWPYASTGPGLVALLALAIAAAWAGVLIAGAERRITGRTTETPAAAQRCGIPPEWVGDRTSTSPS